MAVMLRRRHLVHHSLLGRVLAGNFDCNLSTLQKIGDPPRIDVKACVRWVVGVGEQLTTLLNQDVEEERAWVVEFAT